MAALQQSDRSNPAFFRSVRFLQIDNFWRSSVVFFLTFAFLTLWGAWFFAAQVRVSATSSSARLEVERQVHPIESSISGKVLENRLVLGSTVNEDDIVIKLDARGVELKLRQERARLTSLSSQLAVLESELDAEHRVLRHEKSKNRVALEEAHARENEIRTSALFASEKAKRWDTLASGGVVTEIDSLQAQAQSEQLSQQVKTLSLGRKRLKQEGRLRLTSQKAVIAGLDREHSQIRGEILAAQATIKTLEHELEKHSIRIPISGRIGHITPLKIGTIVESGQRLGAVVPEGEIRAVALYSPAQAAGKLNPGQRARVRLDGFPWTQYGIVHAKVQYVALEPHDGLLRVELQLVSPQQSRIPLEHGMPGTAEIDVERVSPATLVLRAAGKLVSEHTSGSDRESP